MVCVNRGSSTFIKGYPLRLSGQDNYCGTGLQSSLSEERRSVTVRVGNNAVVSRITTGLSC